MITVEDGKTKKATTFINSERFDDADFTAGKTYESWADNIMQDYYPLITGKIVFSAIVIPVTIDEGVIDQTGRPLANSDVEEGATFVWKTAGGFTTRFRIPTFNEACMISGSAEVDLANNDVDDFVQTIIDGADAIAGVGEDRMNVTDSRGDDIIAIKSAFDAFQKSRKR